MQPTEKLYFTDSDLLQFQATVLAVETAEAGENVLLDCTAFYPTGGGQPHDTGKLDDAAVVDVNETADGRILHRVKPAGKFSVGQQVSGSVERQRRLDHLQQHSGQHILSQAFIQAIGAQTRSFHLGAQTSTIDIEMPPSASLSMEEACRAAEEIANAVIFENRPLRVHLLDEAGAAKMELRKESAVAGTIRVIEVENFDRSPCGGTHAKMTGQIGLIAIRGFERVKGHLLRVEFVCGNRALQDYRRAHQSALTTARLFSAERDAAPELVAKTLQENKSLKKRQKELLDLAMTAEAASLLQNASQADGFKLIEVIFNDRDAEELRLLAQKATAQEPAIALLASRNTDAARLVFARSADLPQHMGQLLTQACQILGGRGGGKAEMAQGGGSNLAKLEEALQWAHRSL